MANKNKLTEILKARNPLSQPREAVTPANLYTSTQTDKVAKTTENRESTQVDKPTSIQEHKTTTPQTDKDTKPLRGKYTTHLTPQTIKALKRYAFEAERKDYEVVQEAIDEYLKARKQP